MCCSFVSERTKSRVDSLVQQLTCKSCFFLLGFLRILYLNLKNQSQSQSLSVFLCRLISMAFQAYRTDTEKYSVLLLLFSSHICGPQIVGHKPSRLTYDLENELFHLNHRINQNRSIVVTVKSRSTAKMIFTTYAGHQKGCTHTHTHNMCFCVSVFVRRFFLATGQP